VPPRWEAVVDAMRVLFDLLEQENEAAVRAVLGHWLIGYIHPFPDGNGRIARFMMNVMLASGGYPWIVIRVEDRTSYMETLESASVDGDIRPFASFIASRIQGSMALTVQAASAPVRQVQRAKPKSTSTPAAKPRGKRKKRRAAADAT